MRSFRALHQTGGVLKDHPIPLYMVSVVNLHLLSSTHCVISIGIESEQGCWCTEQLRSAPTWN